MEDYTLILRELMKKDIEKINFSVTEEVKKEFEKTAENYLIKDMILEAIKTFALTKNIEKLTKIGNDCIKNKKIELALKAFYYAKNKEGLNKTGEEFLKQGEINNALFAFKFAENKEMTEFLSKNF